MEAKASKRLAIGSRVRFSQDGVLGTVTEKNWMAVKIAWDDGQIGIIHHDDMQDVSRDLSVEMVDPSGMPAPCSECGSGADEGHARNCSKRAWR